MDSNTMVYGKTLVVDYNTVIPNGAVVFSKDRILAVGPYSEMKEKFRPSTIYGSSDMMVAPGFINAHGHGRGLTDFQLGSTDDVLEAWKYRTYPGLDLYYDTVWRSLQMLKSGITATMHNHNLQDPHNSMQEFHTALDAYESTGIRAGFAPTLIDDNIVLYSDRDAFMGSVSLDVQELVQAIEDKAKAFDLKSYLESVDELLSSRTSPTISILHGPLAPQWCTGESLQAIRDHAKNRSLRIHIHILQTVLQKEFSRRHRKSSLVEDLADIGFLGPHTTCGHAIWLTEQDIQTLADSGTSLTTHSSCNLRIQSGLSPVRSLLAAGIKVGIGMDDKTFNDEKDFFEEIRLTARLHRLGAYTMLEDPLSSANCFRMATEWGAEMIGFPTIGTLAPGKQADIVLMDMESMAFPYTYPDHSPLDLILYRGKPDHVHSVFVNGRCIVDNGNHMLIDRDEMVAKLKESLSQNYPEKFRKENHKFQKLKQELASFYRTHGWYDSMESEKSPYYVIHNKE